jgi:hypothetical protein
MTPIVRRQHRRIATQLLNPKAIEGYAHVLDYEAHILIRSLYHETGMGKLPINPAHFVGRYALKYVAYASSLTRESDGCVNHSNMLTITFGTRTDSTVDPLTESALALATEFNDLTGKSDLPYLMSGPLTMVGHRSTNTQCRLYQNTAKDSFCRAVTSPPAA